jgi:hypothetical protein
MSSRVRLFRPALVFIIYMFIGACRRQGTRTHTLHDRQCQRHMRRPVQRWPCDELCGVTRRTHRPQRHAQHSPTPTRVQCKRCSRVHTYEYTLCTELCTSYDKYRSCVADVDSKCRQTTMGALESVYDVICDKSVRVRVHVAHTHTCRW